MKVSIITVSLNSQATISSTVRSVIGQDYPDIEYLVIDGGSQDGTLEQLVPYRHRITTLVSEPDRGLYDAMNKGIALATGDVIGFLHADDQYSDTEIIGRVVKVFGDAAVEASYGDLVYVDAADLQRITRYWSARSYSRSKFYWGWMPPHPTFFVRRQCYQRYGGYRLDMGSSADYELMLRYFLCHDLQAVYLSHVMVQMQSGGVSNASLINRLWAHVMDWKAWWVNGLVPYPWTMPCKPLRKLGQWCLPGDK